METISRFSYLLCLLFAAVGLLEFAQASGLISLITIASLFLVSAPLEKFAAKLRGGNVNQPHKDELVPILIKDEV